ncbi:MAG: hypothetical protein IIX05_09955, partial [Selenomonadaceae bacterium]|nr:hypothetical protein [Selenomonadaceae bacterium]
MQLPDWLKKEEQYIPGKDRDYFISRSFLRITGILARYEAAAPFLPDRLCPSPMAAMIFLLLLLLLVVTSSQPYFLYTVAALLLALLALQDGRRISRNPQKRWNESNPIQSLAAPVGIGTDGNLFYLDLHQKYQGPHGLVAGMTGSGKSEFLITYILSMAVNYHPDEIAFVLIDYKGGGLAGAFDNPTKGI